MDMMKRNNCWEVQACGRQSGGKNVEELGVCPAAEHSKYDGINRGTCSGRFCWAVEGTLCCGKSQGSSVIKLMNCLNCEFMKQVSEDEGRNFILSPKDISTKSKPET